MKRSIAILLSGLSIFLAPETRADLIHHWPFDDGFEDAVSDAHGTSIGGADITDDARIGEGALAVDGSGDCVQVQDRDSLKFKQADSYTVAAWVKAAPGTSGWRGVVTKGRDAAPWYGIWINPQNLWTFGVSATNALTGPAVIPGEWTHVAIVQDGDAGTREMYIDGALVGTEIARDASNSGRLLFGGAASVNEWFVGAIDDVQIYDEALQAEDIAELAGLFPVSDLACERNGAGGANLSWTNHPSADPAEPIRIEVNGVEAIEVSGNATGATLPSDLFPRSFNKICVINSSGAPACCELFVADPIAIHHWPFESDFEDAASDADGTPIGGADITDDARIGDGALAVNGFGASVQVSDRESLKFTQAESYTVAAWVKVAPGTSGWRGVVTKGRDAPPWYGIWINPQDLWTFGVPATNALTGPAAIPEEWTHVAIVQNGVDGTREMYIDGALVGTEVARDASNPGNLLFGGAASVNEWFVGAIDDVWIYDVPLTEDLIASLARGEVDDRPRFIRGDTDGNGVYVLNDGIQILERLFAGRQEYGSKCDKTGDVDDNGILTIGDAIRMFNFLFADGPEPPAPSPSCGPDPTPDVFTCEAYPQETCPPK